MGSETAKGTKSTKGEGFGLREGRSVVGRGSGMRENDEKVKAPGSREKRSVAELKEECGYRTKGVSSDDWCVSCVFSRWERSKGTLRCGRRGFRVSQTGTCKDGLSKYATGHAAMEKWDPTWQHLRIPKWAEPALRAHPDNRNRRELGLEHLHIPGEWSGVFDHWGTIKRGEEEFWITQPYGDVSEEIARVATELGCTAVYAGQGPWSKGVTLWVLEKNAEHTDQP